MLSNAKILLPDSVRFGRFFLNIKTYIYNPDYLVLYSVSDFCWFGGAKKQFNFLVSLASPGVAPMLFHVRQADVGSAAPPT